MKKQNGEPLTNILNIVFIELTHLDEKYGSEELERLSAAEKWALFLKNADNMNSSELVRNLTEKEDGIMNAQSVLSSISSDRGLWLAQYHAEVRERAESRTWKKQKLWQRKNNQHTARAISSAARCFVCEDAGLCIRRKCASLKHGGAKMSYEAVLTQVKSVPEACLEDISNYIDYVVYRYEQKKNQEEKEPSPELASAMLEALQISGDPSVKCFATTKELFEDLNSWHIR